MEQSGGEQWAAVHGNSRASEEGEFGRSTAAPAGTTTNEHLSEHGMPVTAS